MIIEKSCGAVVYKKIGKDIEFLSVKSKKNGHYGFPKGHVEKGETEEETAKREVFEETGLDIILLDEFRAKIKYPLYESKIKEVVLFIGQAPEQIVCIQQDEIEEYKWLNYDDMINLLTYESSKRVLTEVKGFLDKIYD
jgi:tRNA nucleotidyltransferase (CCA-adding enzyme)